MDPTPPLMDLATRNSGDGLIATCSMMADAHERRARVAEAAKLAGEAADHTGMAQLCRQLGGWVHMMMYVKGPQTGERRRSWWRRVLLAMID